MAFRHRSCPIHSTLTCLGFEYIGGNGTFSWGLLHYLRKDILSSKGWVLQLRGTDAPPRSGGLLDCSFSSLYLLSLLLRQRCLSWTESALGGPVHCLRNGCSQQQGLKTQQSTLMAHPIEVNVDVLHPSLRVSLSLSRVHLRTKCLFWVESMVGCLYELLPSSRRWDIAARTHLDPLT